MTSTDSLNTLATAECPSSERLKHYLSGWLDDVDAEQLEQHLNACKHCESAMRQVDVHQETLLQSLQATMVQEPGLPAASTSPAQNGSPDSSPADPSKCGSAVIDEALSKARRLLDTPLEPENDPKPVAWHPTHRDFGCYELLRPLGRGGMGAVYLARHRQLGKQVAIKLLPVMSAEDSDVRTRFDREIRVVGRLNHPSIVAATDAGEIEGTQFLVMEYVPGLDLSRLARLMGRLPVAEACELIRQASLGLSCAHAEGVVHRDIKPSNLMLDDLGRIRILDFGLAQWTVWDEASVDLTTVGQLMGTLDYMAPEQAEAIGAVDYRADLYALGATLFRLLCGRAPLAAAPNQSPLEKLRLLSNHQPPKLSTLCPEAPEELVKLVASLLSRSPSDRPASAAHVAEQLAPFAEGAKLVELLQQAKEKAAASPELLKRTALYEPPFPGAPVPMSSPEPAALNGGGRFKTLRRLLLAASLPLMIIAGILIKLELNKGQLIIESDVDNVNVKVLKDGKPVDGIQVNHGTMSTRLYADNYEITIDGPSDGLIIDHDKFTLKNGETVVARIQKTAAPNEHTLELSEESGTQNSTGTTDTDHVTAMRRELNELEVEFRLQQMKLGSNHPKIRLLQEEILIRSRYLDAVIARMDAASNSSRPLYNGQPLEHWLDMIGRERSVEGLKVAFDACDALVSKENSPIITETLLKFLPVLDGELRVLDKEANSYCALDYVAARLLWKANPGAQFFTMWVKERSESKEEKWSQRLDNYATHGYISSSDEVQPFMNWARFVLAPVNTGTVDPGAVQSSADLLRGMLNNDKLRADETFVSTATAILTESPYLSDEWWLSQPLLYRGPQGDRELFPAAYQQNVVRKAIVALQTQTDPALVAQACMILANGAKLDREQTDEVLKAIQKRIEQTVQTPEFFAMVHVPLSFSSFAVTALETKDALKIGTIQWGVHTSMVQFFPVSDTSLAMQLLNMIATLDTDKTCEPQCRMVLEAARSVFDRVRVRYDERADRLAASLALGTPRMGRTPVQLRWPELTRADSDQGQGKRSEVIDSRVKDIWGDHAPTPSDWLQLLILNHPAMHDVIEKELATQPAPVSTEESID